MAARIRSFLIASLAMISITFSVAACSLLPPPTPPVSSVPPTTVPPSTTIAPTPPPRNLVSAICENATATSTSAALPPSLNELSGVAASRNHSNIVWGIEDSGNPAVISAIGLDGSLRASISLSGASNIDWEALALRSGPRGDQLIVADIGDNSASRPDVTFYFLDEPAVASTTVTPTRITATYADGPHNAEALVATQSEIFVVTKQGGISSVYRLEGSLLQPTGMLPDNPGLVTDASVSFDGTMTALRTYTSVRIAQVSDGGVIGALRSMGCTMPFTEPQGEAITFLPDGSGLVSVSEIAPTALRTIRPAQ